MRINRTATVWLDGAHQQDRDDCGDAVIPYVLCKSRQRHGGGKMIIETERLLLREMTEADFDALYRVLSDSDICNYQRIKGKLSQPL